MLSIDHWRPDKMEYKGSGRWALNRMVPRVVITYCFEIVKSGVDAWRTSAYSTDQPKCFDSSAPTATVNVIDVEGFELFAADVDYDMHYAPELNGGINQDDVCWPFFKQVMPLHLKHDHCLPRGNNWEAVTVEGKEVWSLDKSKLFATRKRENAVGTFWDTDELVEKAFLSDWERIVVKLERMRILPEDINLLGELIGMNYKMLCVLFKTHIVSSRSNSFVLPMIAFEQFLTKCDISDNVAVKKRDIDRIFISTTADKHKDSQAGGKRKTIQSTGLDRCEWVEALVRVARLKYQESKIVDTTSNAFACLWDDHLK
jgi:hypothetical protein